jgi:chemotaxis protein CheD
VEDVEVMVQYTVGISDMKISNVPGDILITYSLGSCVGLSLYDPDLHLGGLIHCMLPTSKIDPERARTNPCMFTDSGVSQLLQEMLNRGAQKRRLIAKVAGAAKLLDDDNTFRIGERNIVVLRKMLWKNNILIAADDTGGTIARTVVLRIADGVTEIRSGGKIYEL